MRISAALSPIVLAALTLLAACACAGPLPDSTDFGDAPEGIPAYPGGPIGHFPTCLTPGLQREKQPLVQIELRIRFEAIDHRVQHLLARQHVAVINVSLVGPKKAKEMWFLCRQYDAEEALEMGLVNTVVALDELEEQTVGWCREMLAMSPMALRLCKASFNAAEDGFSGIQQLAHDANLLFYENSEAQEGRDAYREKRTPDFSRFPKRP